MSSLRSLLSTAIVVSFAVGCALDTEPTEPTDEPSEVGKSEAPAMVEPSQPGASPCVRGVPLILPNGEVAWMPADCTPYKVEPGDPSPQVENPMRDPRLDELGAELGDDSVHTEAR